MHSSPSVFNGLCSYYFHGSIVATMTYNGRGSLEVDFCEARCLHFYYVAHQGPTKHLVTFLILVMQTQPWRGTGVAVPVFSIRSTHNVGAGEFLDLKVVVDMAAKTGMRLVQLLPVNDTSVNMMWWDSYPYRYV